MCLSPIINHTIQQQHCTSRPGLSPRQPDSKIPSLQMALREDLYMCMWERNAGVRVCNVDLLMKIQQSEALPMIITLLHVNLCTRV